MSHPTRIRTAAGRIANQYCVWGDRRVTSGISIAPLECRTFVPTPDLNNRNTILRSSSRFRRRVVGHWERAATEQKRQTKEWSARTILELSVLSRHLLQRSLPRLDC